jgi:anthranilate phosphoribosyltransferase
MLLDVLNNKPGPAKDIVMLNAGAAIYVARIASDLWGGVARAREMIESGLARQKLEALIGFNNSVSGSA